MKILAACEESQTVCIELRKLGHEAYSADIQEPSGGHPEWHILGDVLPLINGRCSFQTMDGANHEIKDKWDMLIAFPPCTYLSNAGNASLFPDGILNKERYKKGLEAKAFFMSLYNADCSKIAIENPISSRIYGMPPFSQEVHPWMFGHEYEKTTRLWLRGLPILMATEIVPWVSTWCPSSTTGNKGAAGSNPKNRSKTFQGLARAMAEQWAGNCTGNFVK